MTHEIVVKMSNMKAYILKDEDFNELLDKLELFNLNKNNMLTSEEPTKEDVHRAFWYVVVRWAQRQGYSTVDRPS